MALAMVARDVRRRARARGCRGLAPCAGAGTLPLHLLLPVVLAAAAFLPATRALGGPSGLGATPAMGWNSWNSLRCELLSHAAVVRAADRLLSSGLAEAGYDTVVVDDCWMASRDATGRIVPDAAKFPDGIKAVADAVHARGLKFGIYSDSGDKTCEGYPGSSGFEEMDAKTYAEWGVDFLKYDFCNDKRTPREAYTLMANALRAAGREIRFSLCSWGAGAPWQWGASVAHSWRTGRDLFAVWGAKDAKKLGLPNYLQSVLEAVDNQARLARYSGPGAYNDPDMLTVGLDKGMRPYGIVEKCPPAVPDCRPGEYITRERWGYVGGLTQVEQRTHFALWCIMAAPLMLGNNLADEEVTPETLSILTAAEVLAIDQDALGVQGRPTSQVDGGKAQVWAKPLTGGRVALLLLNRGEEARDVRVSWATDVAAALADAAERAAAASAPSGATYDAECAAKDDNVACGDWASSGECQRNAGYMLQSCACACAAAERSEATRARAASGAAIGLGPGAVWSVRDAWARAKLGEFSDGWVAEALPPHGHALIVVEEALEAAHGAQMQTARRAGDTTGGDDSGAMRARAQDISATAADGPLVSAQETWVVLLAVVGAVALFARTHRRARRLA